MKCNGTYVLTVQTRHGQFAFPNQKFWCTQRGSHAFLQASEACASAVTRGLQSLAVQTCLQAGSYEKARQLLEEVTGASLLTRQTLCHWVANTAQRLDRPLAQAVQQGLQLPLPPFVERVDAYDPASPEVIVFEDGILVKAQKPTHEKRTPPQSAVPAGAQALSAAGAQALSAAGAQVKPCQFHQSYFALAPDREGSYQFVLASSDGATTLPDALRAFVSTQWQDAPDPLALIAITDGARDLHNDLLAAFGAPLVTILDWFHLRKKVCEICSMLVSTKQARTDLKKQMLKLLFFGKVSEALAVLTQLPVRNATLHQKLVTYLSKQAHEIIDYARRQKAGKTIGSGRMEKGVDQVIGIRQKDNGMSWSKAGSYALGMLTASCANGSWNQLWNAAEMTTA